MVCGEAAGLQQDMANATEKRCGGLLHFMKNGANETKQTQHHSLSQQHKICHTAKVESGHLLLLQLRILLPQDKRRQLQGPRHYLSGLSDEGPHGCLLQEVQSPLRHTKPQEVSSSPKKSYPPSEVRRSPPGKDKPAELKD